ncbi:MAG TPA: prefoldin subunit alpha [Candidatus Nanoarchaeia archaeon]|nr:prefoldin subunit alpha [Candidatus Nanoarchaeia archaeon]
METNEKKAQEIYMEYQMLEQGIKQLQKQLEMVTQQIMEVASTSSSLDDFKKTKEGTEILVPVSSGIFARASLKDSSELLVNVGSGVVVKKTVEDAKKLLEGQLNEMQKVQKHMVDELEKMANKAESLEKQLQSMMPQQTE